MSTYEQAVRDICNGLEKTEFHIPGPKPHIIGLKFRLEVQLDLLYLYTFTDWDVDGVMLGESDYLRGKPSEEFVRRFVQTSLEDELLRWASALGTIKMKGV